MLNEAKDKIVSSIIIFVEKNCTSNKLDDLTFLIEELSNNIDSDILKQTLLDLSDTNNIIYVTLKDKISSLDYFCNEIIIVYTLKLRLFFNVNTSEIPNDLKKMFYKSFEMQNSSNTKKSVNWFYTQ